MKKLLSILGAIGLTTTSTTSLTSCDKPNNSENEGGNKPEPEKPPENSNWKLILLDKLNSNPDNKWYIGIVKKNRNDNFSIIKFNFSDKSIWVNNGVPYHIINRVWYLFKSYYCWDGLNEPETPKIDSKTGKITDWKG